MTSAALVPLAGLAGLGQAQAARGGANQARSSPAVGAAGPANTAPYQPAFFNADEWAFMLAACERLIPSDELGPGARETGVADFIDHQMQGSYGAGAHLYLQGPFAAAPPELGYQGKLTPAEIYRQGIAACNVWCRQRFGGKVFAALSAAQQDEVLHAMEGGQANSEAFAAQTFFGFLLQNAREGYLSDPIHGGNKGMASWKLIGFPGARADFLDWVGRNERYPLGPVGIQGTEA